MVNVPRIVIQGASLGVERVFEKLLGRDSQSLASWASQLGEQDLECFPTQELVRTQEENALLLELERDSQSWKALFETVATIEGIDRARLEALACQRYFFVIGRPLSQLRQLLLIGKKKSSIGVATHLPLSVVRRLVSESEGRYHVLPLSSFLLRAHGILSSFGRQLAMHFLNSIRLIRFLTLPKPPRGNLPSYVAFLSANAAELARCGRDKLSLLEFLKEANSSSIVETIVVQSSTSVVDPPENVIYRRSRAALRYRPPLGALLRTLGVQMIRVMRDLVGILDWRVRLLISPSLLDLPSYRLWFKFDPPKAVLYANSVIGGEPPASLIGAQYSVRSMMLFYSTNVAYCHRPIRRVGAGLLEPEIRFIISDQLGMWSEEMQAAFLTTGYSLERLPVVGVVHFGRQKGFCRRVSRPDSGSNRGIRLGVFDVSTLLPERRFMSGWGQTLYHQNYCNQFFSDLIQCARSVWGEDFVLIRKLKRQLNPEVHAQDVELDNLLKLNQLITPPADASLWALLKTIDVVVCMPFTSVAYMAEQYGIPSAYYDPSNSVTRSPLSGRAPLLSDQKSLGEWLTTLPRPIGHDPEQIVATQVLSAACGGGWCVPRSMQERLNFH